MHVMTINTLHNSIDNNTLLMCIGESGIGKSYAIMDYLKTKNMNWIYADPDNWDTAVPNFIKTKTFMDYSNFRKVIVFDDFELFLQQRHAMKNIIALLNPKTTIIGIINKQYVSKLSYYKKSPKLTLIYFNQPTFNELFIIAKNVVMDKIKTQQQLDKLKSLIIQSNFNISAILNNIYNIFNKITLDFKENEYERLNNFDIINNIMKGKYNASFMMKHMHSDYDEIALLAHENAHKCMNLENYKLFLRNWLDISCIKSFDTNIITIYTVIKIHPICNTINNSIQLKYPNIRINNMQSVVSYRKRVPCILDTYIRESHIHTYAHNCKLKIYTQYCELCSLFET